MNRNLFIYCSHPSRFFASCILPKHNKISSVPAQIVTSLPTKNKNHFLSIVLLGPFLLFLLRRCILLTHDLYKLSNRHLLPQQRLERNLNPKLLENPVSKLHSRHTIHPITRNRSFLILKFAHLTHEHSGQFLREMALHHLQRLRLIKRRTTQRRDEIKSISIPVVAVSAPWLIAYASPENRASAVQKLSKFEDIARAALRSSLASNPRTR
jgi:hypothetical protein